MSARIERVSIVGLKGQPAVYDVTPLTFVVGLNGQGKSRIREAIDFALGRDVAGVSANGGELRAALAGSLMDVTLDIRVAPDRVVDLRRVRRLEKGTFKKAVVYLDGVESTPEQVADVLGDVTAPNGAAWLDMSEDKLMAELARLGARARDGRAIANTAALAVSTHGGGALCDALCDALSRPRPPGITLPSSATKEERDEAERARQHATRGTAATCPADAVIMAAREVAKAEANAAQKELRGIEGSAGRSQQVSRVDDGEEIRPETLAAKDAEVAKATDELAQAQKKEAEARQSVITADVEVRRHDNRGRELAARVEVVQIRVQRLSVPSHGAVDAPTDQEVEAATSAAAAAKDYVATIRTEYEEASQSERAAETALVETRSKLSSARKDLQNAAAAVDVLNGGHCPTCRQAIVGGVLAPFLYARDAADAMVRDAELAAGTADSALSEIRAYKADMAAELRAATQAEAATTAVVADLDRRRFYATDAAQAESARLEGLAAANAELAVAQKAVAEHAASQRPAAPEDARTWATACAGEVSLCRATLDRVQQERNDLTARGERYRRWRDDLAQRARVEARKKLADELLENIRNLERELAGQGAEMLLSAAAMYVPAALGTPRVLGGAVGLERGADFWSGPGLSSAQRVVLALAIDRALDAVTERKLRLAAVEVEALDDSTLEAVCDALAWDVVGGALDGALLLSCHTPRALPADWTMLRIGDTGPPAGPGGGERHDMPMVAAVSQALNMQDAAVDGYTAILAGHPATDLDAPTMEIGDIEFVLPDDEPDVSTPAHSEIPPCLACGGGECTERYAAPRTEEQRAQWETVKGLSVDPELVTGSDGRKTIRSLSLVPDPDGEIQVFRGDQHLSPEAAEVLASIVEADGPVQRVDQPALALDGTAPKVAPIITAALPDPALLDDAGARSALATIGLPTDGLTGEACRGILARRLQPDNMPNVVTATANAVRANLPQVPPRGIADWLWRPGQTLGDNPAADVLAAVRASLSARALNELALWPNTGKAPLDGDIPDAEVLGEFVRALLVVEGGPAAKLTPAGRRLWEVMHDVAPPPPGVGVTEAEARKALAGVNVAALRALGAARVDLDADRNMTVGKRRDDIAARLAKMGATAEEVAAWVAQAVAENPPRKSLTNNASNGNDAVDGNEAVVAAEE